MNVFTYWEGELPFVNKVCIDSVTNIYGSSHIHLTPRNVHNYIKVPSFIKNHKSVAWRSDYIRGSLLYEFGGIWLDCDIILNRKIHIKENQNRPKIWKEGGFPINDCGKYKDLPELCIGTMYSPHGHHWLHEVFRRFEEQSIIFDKNKSLQKWVSGQRLYRDVIYDQGLMEICCECDFNLVYDATYWYQYWDGTIRYSDTLYGIHLLLGAHNNMYQYMNKDIYEYPRRIKNLKNTRDIFREFPNSILAQYIRAKDQENSSC